MTQVPQVPQMDALEHELHVACVEHCDNREIIEVLKRTRCLFITQKHMLGAQLSYPTNEPFMGEHLEIACAMERGDPATVAEGMLAHLERSRPKVIERLGVFRQTFRGAPVPYIR